MVPLLAKGGIKGNPIGEDIGAFLEVTVKNNASRKEIRPRKFR